ncbi:MAG TPA: GNAT family N-acetyltransferase, partial [Brevibacterium sp.]|nr:GNAT family N-acetyltransferase [Brevibacterium sp.]
MLRPASDGDRDRILAWRNHDEVRAVSLTQHVISADEHARWWDATMADDSRQVLVYERDRLPSGVVSFWDLTESSGWWGYYLDNAGVDERGVRFPAWISIQREAVKYARDILGLRELHGETLTSNESVREFNARQGFEELSTGI